MTGIPCFALGHSRRAVPLRTVAAISRRIPTDRSYELCEAAGCDVVYLGADGDVIRVGELVVMPGFKAPDDGLVCYCFEIRASSVEAAARRGDATSTALEIRRRVAAGECRCAVTNPTGRCCLPDVQRAASRAAECAAVCSPA